MIGKKPTPSTPGRKTVGAKNSRPSSFECLKLIPAARATAGKLGFWLPLLAPEHRPSAAERFVICDYVWRKASAAPTTGGIDIIEAATQLAHLAKDAGLDDDAANLIELVRRAA